MPNDPIVSEGFKVRWDEVDPIGHLRHTGYSTFAAQGRLELFGAVGISSDFAEAGVAPILFREELVYRREVRLGEVISITSELSALNDDASRWSMIQRVLRPNGQLAATVETDGAWIDLTLRKLCPPASETAAKMRGLRDSR